MHIRGKLTLMVDTMKDRQVDTITIMDIRRINTLMVYVHMGLMIERV